jgi:chromosome segregation ATPase
LPEKSDEFEIKIDSKEDDDSPYLIGNEGSSKKSEDLVIKLDKLMDRIKLVALELDKKHADLEIKIGKLDERFKEVAYDYPKLRERSEEIENLLHVINLGLVEFKERFDKIDSRISKLEKMPEEVERRIVSLDNKFEKLDEDIKKIYLRLGEIETIKQDVSKSMEEKISSNSTELRKEIDENKIEIEHIKKNLDAISFAMKSFERTVELTNLDDIIRRFDVADRRFLNLQTEIEKLRSSAASTNEGDVEALKRRVKEISAVIMDTLNKINNFEMNMNNKLSKVEVLEKGIMRLNTVQSMTDVVIEEVKKMNEIKNSIEDLYGKIMRIYDSGSVGWDRLQNIVRELSELDKLKGDMQEVKRVVEENKSEIKSMKR